jgi:hypothetical protein
MSLGFSLETLRHFTTMNIRTVLFHAAILSAPVLSVAFANVDDEAFVGRVRSSSADDLRVCFDRRTTISAGQEFDVVRRTLFAPVKGVTGLRSVPSGVIRITGADDGQCASAMLVRGSAQELDWVASRARP